MSNIVDNHLSIMTAIKQKATFLGGIPITYYMAGYPHHGDVAVGVTSCRDRSGLEVGEKFCGIVRRSTCGLETL